MNAAGVVLILIGLVSITMVLVVGILLFKEKFYDDCPFDQS